MQRKIRVAQRSCSSLLDHQRQGSPEVIDCCSTTDTAAATKIEHSAEFPPCHSLTQATSKVTYVQNKICKAIEEMIASLGEKQSLCEYFHDSPMEVMRQQQRVQEFGTRFARNYLYPIERMIADIQNIDSRKGTHDINLKFRVYYLYNNIEIGLVAAQTFLNSLRNFDFDRSYIEKFKHLMRLVLNATRVCVDKRIFDHADDLIKVLNEKCSKLLNFVEMKRDRPVTRSSIATFETRPKHSLSMYNSVSKQKKIPKIGRHRAVTAQTTYQKSGTQTTTSTAMSTTRCFKSVDKLGKCKNSEIRTAVETIEDDHVETCYTSRDKKSEMDGYLTDSLHSIARQQIEHLVSLSRQPLTQDTNATSITKIVTDSKAKPFQTNTCTQSIEKTAEHVVNPLGASGRLENAENDHLLQKLDQLFIQSVIAAVRDKGFDNNNFMEHFFKHELS